MAQVVASPGGVESSELDGESAAPLQGATGQIDAPDPTGDHHGGAQVEELNGDGHAVGIGGHTGRDDVSARLAQVVEFHLHELAAVFHGGVQQPAVPLSVPAFRSEGPGSPRSPGLRMVDARLELWHGSLLGHELLSP